MNDYEVRTPAYARGKLCGMYAVHLPEGKVDINVTLIVTTFIVIALVWILDKWPSFWKWLKARWSRPSKTSGSGANGHVEASGNPRSHAGTIDGASTNRAGDFQRRLAAEGVERAPEVGGADSEGEHVFAIGGAEEEEGRGEDASDQNIGEQSLVTDDGGGLNLTARAETEPTPGPTSA